MSKETNQTLSKKHIAFIDEYFNLGFNGTQAYKKVYNNVADTTAVANASKLLTNAKIKEEIEKRYKILSEKSIVTKEEIIKDLKEIKDKYKNGKIPAHALKSIEILNKMLGFNEPDKIDQTTNGNSINPVSINVNIIRSGN
jgi:phage terminase small subunit